MSRDLASWAQDKRGRPKPKLTWPADLWAAIKGTAKRQIPGDAPAKGIDTRERGPRAVLSGQHLLRRLVALRLDVELVGADALTGVDQPVVFAANEQGALDYQVLRSALPARMRPTMVRLSRALSRGSNVVVFTDEPESGRLVGEFSSIPADLANQHNVAIVPVGLVGTFKLKRILKLSLRTKPKVSIRFGAPIYIRGRSIAEATAEVQARVEQLVYEGDLTWWTIEQRRTNNPAPVPVDTAARWRRLWNQTAPKSEPKPRIWR